MKKMNTYKNTNFTKALEASGNHRCGRRGTNAEGNALNFRALLNKSCSDSFQGYPRTQHPPASASSVLGLPVCSAGITGVLHSAKLQSLAD